MRPQGAVYTHIGNALWDLFNEAGPERKVDVGNPYEIGDYDPNKMEEVGETEE
jgi:hypothetical protein